MFDFKDAETEVTKEEILSKVSEYQLFRYYCKNFEEVDKPFLSEFYYDTKPSCRIYASTNNSLYYKDFGSGEHLGCFDYISKKYNINYYECLKVIANDFSIKSIKVNISPSVIVSNDIIMDVPVKPKVKSQIEIISQNYTSTDYTYWSKYGITLDDLHKEEIISVKVAHLIKGQNVTTFEYRKSNPIYAYKEYDYETNEFIGYKLYFPLASKEGIRFLNNSSSRNIDGYKDLPDKGNLLIITKSRKDRIILKKMGYNVVSLPSEGAKIPEELMDSLHKRFKNITVFLDNDSEGRKYTDNFCMSHSSVNSIFIPNDSGCKDISDYAKKFGVEQGEILIKQLLNKYE